jgi:CYTH domain-containing protein
VDDWRRTPGQGSYARSERERRFLVVGELPPCGQERQIEDRYLTGTRLRLRRVSAGSEVVHKLTQKVRPQADDPFEVALTNVYLEAGEYDRLLVLPAAALRKTRNDCEVDGIHFAVDEFHDALVGLRLAEVEVADLDALLPRPDWLGREVTRDDRYSGGALALASLAQIGELLADG